MLKYLFLTILFPASLVIFDKLFYFFFQIWRVDLDDFWHALFEAYNPAAVDCKLVILNVKI